MAVPTWSQLTFLTANQQTKAAQFASIGQACALWKSGKGPQPDTSAVTYPQARGADLILRDLGSLVGPAKVGIQYVMELHAAEVKAADDAANPPA